MKWAIAALVLFAAGCACPAPRMAPQAERALFDRICQDPHNPAALSAMEPDAVAYLRGLARSRDLDDIKKESSGQWDRDALLIDGRRFIGEAVVPSRGIVVQTLPLRSGTMDLTLALVVDTLVLQANKPGGPPESELWGVLTDRRLVERDIVTYGGYFLKTAAFERADGGRREWMPILVCGDVSVLFWASFPKEAFERGKEYLGYARAMPMVLPGPPAPDRMVLRISEAWDRRASAFHLVWLVDGKPCARPDAAAALARAAREKVFLNVFVTGERTRKEALDLLREAGTPDPWREIIAE